MINEEKEYVRCPKCSYVYEKTENKCPSCGELLPVNEGLENEEVFNLKD